MVAVDRILLRPVPLADLRRVVFLSGLTYHPTEDAVEWWSRSRSLENLAEYATGSAVLNLGDEDELVQATFVSPAFFSTLGIRPSHGRSFEPEDVSSDTPVTVLAEHLARSRWGGPGRRSAARFASTV